MRSAGNAAVPQMAPPFKAGRLHGDRSLPKVGFVQPYIHKHRPARSGHLTSGRKSVGYLIVPLHEKTGGTEPFRHRLVIGATEHRADIVFKEFYLLACNLGPTRIVSHDADNGNAVAHQGVQVGKSVAECAVTEKDPDFASRPRKRYHQREAGSDAERTEGPWIEPGERAARPDDVGRAGDEIASVGYHDRVFAGDLVEFAKEPDWIHESAPGACPLIDLIFPRQVSFPKLRNLIVPVSPGGQRVRSQLLKKPSGVADCRDRRPTIHACLCCAAIRGDKRCRSAYLAAVIEPEIARNSCEDYAIRLAKCLATGMVHLQRVFMAEQPARHARQIHGDAELRDRCGDAIGFARDGEHLAADYHQGSLGFRQRGGGGCHAGVRRRGYRDLPLAWV